MPQRPICLVALLTTLFFSFPAAAEDASRPNVLIAISDDQSWPHASAYGSTLVNTPTFDRIAKEGVLFNNAFCASPGCSPSRAAFLTGRQTWQIEHAGTHASFFST
ncbi:MAG: sulfatase-like hydrolase/transferase, partial [Pirellulaceae bacterium]